MLHFIPVSGKIPILSFSILFLLFSWGGVFSQEEDPETQQVEVIAHYKERSEKKIQASGSVKVRYKAVTLFADYIELDTETRDVFAQGNVAIHLPQEVLSMEEARFNLDSTTGLFQDVHGMIQPSVTYEADTVERKNESVYSFEKAWVTSCTQAVPRWKMSFSRANFKRNDYMEMWNTVFTVKKVPVFYLPYMRYPLESERATGFLMPQLGYNGRKGFTYTQNFYWAMRKNMDATLSWDYYSSRGIGGGFEYRYLFPGGVGGQINLFYFHFKNPTEEADPSNAYIIRYKHDHPLPFAFRMVADVDFQSSFDFLREFDNDFRRAVVSNRRSQMYLSRAWSYFNLNARISRFETYFMQTGKSIIRQSFPEVSLTSSKIKIFSPLYFSFNSTMNRWQYGWDTEFKKGTQKSAQDFFFSPTVTVPFTSIPWLTLNSSISSNVTYYFQSYAPDSKKKVSDVVDEPLLSWNHSLHFELIGPVFYKIYFGSDGKPKLKHIIEPTFTYHYDSPVSSSDRIITTRFFYLNYSATYGLTHRFLIKQNNMPREVVTLGVSQSFYFKPEESPLQIYEVDGEIPQYSDISGYLRVYPSEKYSLDLSAAFNPYHTTFSRLRLGALLGAPSDNIFLRINWYKSINPYRESALLSRHQVSVLGKIRIPQIMLEVQAEFDFNIQKRELLYSAFLLAYRYQCLDFRTDFRIFYFREKPEAQFRITLGLGNIGKSTNVLSGLEL